MPLYRQHQRLKDAGITLSRSTLTNYTQRAIELLGPIVDTQWQHILQSKVLAMDETPIKAGRKKKGQMQSAWYWPIYGEDDELCFTWSSSRGSAHIEQQLAGFEGVLLSDGYAAYDRYARNKPQITQAQCWAHTRRYFERAHKSDPAAQEALTLIGGLYRVEQQIREKDLEGQKKLDYRSRHALPIADAFFAWRHQQRQLRISAHRDHSFRSNVTGHFGGSLPGISFYRDRFRGHFRNQRSRCRKPRSRSPESHPTHWNSFTLSGTTVAFCLKETTNADSEDSNEANHRSTAPQIRGQAQP